MNFGDLANNVGRFLWNALPPNQIANTFSKANETANYVQQEILPDPKQWVSNQFTKISNTQIPHSLSDFPYYLTRPDEYVRGQLGVSPDKTLTVGNMFSLPAPKDFVRQSAKTLLENVLPATIGTIPLPVPSGWSLPRALTTTGLFSGLQKLAGYSNEEVFNPVNIGGSLIYGGLKFGETPQAVKSEPLKYYGSTTEKLRALFHPEQVEQNLLARGFSKKQIKTISVPDYINIVENNIAPSKFYNIKKSSIPFTREGQSFSRLFSEWVGERQASLVRAIENNKKYKNIPIDKTWEIVNFLEYPNMKVSPEIRNLARQIRNDYNIMFSEARSSGLDINFIKNYITHLWSESPEKVSEVFRSTRKNFKFAKERTIPTYLEGKELGLTPKYQHIAQIMSEYTRKFYETKANVRFLENLKKEGLIKTAQIVGDDPNWSPIIAKGFPRMRSVINGQIIFSPYYAPEEIANLINRVFSEQKSPLSKLANVSGGTQDVVMSGGIPKTPANAWSFAQLTKEFAAGRIMDPIRAFIRSFSGKASNKYFEKNAGQIKKMQLRNIPVSTTYNIENMISRGAIRDTFGERFTEAWNKTVNEPTFKRFMPQLEIELFNSIEKQALEKGLSQTEAGDIAALAVRKFYGITGSDKSALQSQFSKDVKSAFFFAPRYRESMISFWTESLKSLKDPLALENRTNIRFLIGTVLTYIVMNQINKGTTGKSMSENPPGTEDKLLIPLSDGNTLGIPFLSSIATMPRLAYRMGNRILEGDIKGTFREGRGTLSSLLRPLSDIAFNENYYGQEIYSDQDSRSEKLKKIGLHLAGGYNHPYIKALIDRYAKHEPGYQTLSKAFELPFRFYKTSSLDEKYYYANKDEVLKGLDQRERLIYDKLHEGKLTDEDGLPIWNQRSEMANALDRLANPKVLQAEALIALKTAEKTGEQINPFYLLDPKQQETVLILKTFYPGDSTKSTVTNANISWLKEYWAKRDTYVSDLVNKGIIKESGVITGKPEVSEDLRALLDYYFTLPSGTGQRSAFIRQNPEVLQYFNENRDYTNSQRADLGLPLLAGFSSSGSWGNKAGKKVSLAKSSIRKPGKIRLATSKIKRIKALKVKAPKVKQLKIRNIKPGKKIKIKKLKGLSGGKKLI